MDSVGTNTAIATAAESFGRTLTPVPSSRLVLAIAIEVLPTITDDVTANLVSRLALAIVDLQEELGAVRPTLWASLELSHAQHTELVRLRRCLADLRDARRRERMSAV